MNPQRIVCVMYSTALFTSDYFSNQVMRLSHAHAKIICFIIIHVQQIVLKTTVLIAVFIFGITQHLKLLVANSYTRFERIRPK